jgi:glycerol-3-phosphate acyltransferase PlsY
MIEILLSLVGAFFIGAVPFGYIIVKILRQKDIRGIGSGNIGATNVYRAAGAIPAIIVLLLDILKGTVAVIICKMITPISLFWILAGLLVISGHGFSPFLRFRGGKGVATSLGVVLAIFPKPLLFLLPIFIIIVLLTKYVSLGSILCGMLLPIFSLLFSQDIVLRVFSLFIASFIFIKHIPNIKRLIQGKENKLSFRF